MDQKKTFGGNQRGRIILLGDGTEVLTDSDDTEMFDHSEEDKDLASQVHKGQATSQDERKSEKNGSTDPSYKGVADKFLTNSNEPTEKKRDEKTAQK
jgi:protein phosphatase 2C family protein 2/3